MQFLRKRKNFGKKECVVTKMSPTLSSYLIICWGTLGSLCFNEEDFSFEVSQWNPFRRHHSHCQYVTHSENTPKGHNKVLSKETSGCDSQAQLWDGRIGGTSGDSSSQWGSTWGLQIILLGGRHEPKKSLLVRWICKSTCTEQQRART